MSLKFGGLACQVCAQVGHDAAIATSFFATLPFVVGTATFFTKIQTSVVQDAMVLLSPTSVEKRSTRCRSWFSQRGSSGQPLLRPDVSVIVMWGMPSRQITGG